MGYNQTYYTEHREQRLEQSKKWATNNPEKRKVVYVRARKKCSAKIAEIKHIRGCKVCDESDARCLDFHHRDPEYKIGSVSQLASRASWDRVLAEIEKCEVLCANCHRKLEQGTE